MQEWPVTRVTYFQGLHLWNHERRHRNLKDKSGDMGSQSVLTLDIVTNYSIKTPWSLKWVVKSRRLGPTSPAWQNAFWSSGYYTVSILLLWYSSGFFILYSLCSCILFTEFSNPHEVHSVSQIPLSPIIFTNTFYMHI